MTNIRLESIYKSFGNNVALENINLLLEENKIYGLLGRNGAGKSTMLNIINNRIFATKGKVFIENDELTENSEAIANFHYMGDINLMPSSYRVKDMFNTTSMFYKDYDMTYALETSKRFKLDINKKILKLSTGYNTIAKAINALATNADVLLLDEPVLGLDANHRKLLYHLIMESYIQRPKTIVLSTHIIEEISKLIENVVIIKSGKLFIDEAVDDFLIKFKRVSGKSEDVLSFIKDKEVVSKNTLGNISEAIIKGSFDEESLLKYNLEVSSPELQDIFVAITEEGEYESI